MSLENEAAVVADAILALGGKLLEGQSGSSLTRGELFHMVGGRERQVDYKAIEPPPVTKPLADKISSQP